jgi:uncharacterized protein
MLVMFVNMMSENLRAQENLIEKIRKIAKRKTKPYGCHGWDHVDRVYDLCCFIGEKEGGDLETLKIAALLHDIARDRRGDHARNSAKEAERIMRELGFHRSKIYRIVDAIKTHRFTGKSRPRTLEAKILADADKLDAMGAVGIYRAAAFGAEVQRPIQRTIDHFNEKLLKLKAMMYTKTARGLAEGRHKFMLAYLEQIEKEIKIIT